MKATYERGMLSVGGLTLEICDDGAKLLGIADPKKKYELEIASVATEISVPTFKKGQMVRVKNNAPAHYMATRPGWIGVVVSKSRVCSDWYLVRGPYGVSSTESFNFNLDPQYLELYCE